VFKVYSRSDGYCGLKVRYWIGNIAIKSHRTKKNMFYEGVKCIMPSTYKIKQNVENLNRLNEC